MQVEATNKSEPLNPAVELKDIQIQPPPPQQEQAPTQEPPPASSSAAYVAPSSSSDPPPPTSISSQMQQKGSDNSGVAPTTDRSGWDRPMATDSDAVSSTEGLDSVHSLGIHASSHQYRQPSPPPQLAGYYEPRLPSPPPAPYPSAQPSDATDSQGSNLLTQQSEFNIPAPAASTSSASNVRKQLPKSASAGRNTSAFAPQSAQSGAASEGGLATPGIHSPSPSMKRRSEATSVASPGSPAPLSTASSMERSPSMQSQGSRVRSTLQLGPSLLGRPADGSEGPRAHRPQTHLGIGGGNQGNQQQQPVGILRNTIIENLVKSGPVESSPRSSVRDSGTLQKSTSFTRQGSAGGRAPRSSNSPNPGGGGGGWGGGRGPGPSQQHSSRSTTDRSNPSTLSAASSFILAN